MINININSKIYYLKTNGKVILITPEYSLNFEIEKSNLDADYKKYAELQLVNKSDIDFIELEYGKFNSLFINAKSYNVNIKSKELEIIYFTKEELEELEKENNTSSSASRIEELEKENEKLIDEIIDLKVENLLLQMMEE